MARRPKTSAAPGRIRNGENVCFGQRGTPRARGTAELSSGGFASGRRDPGFPAHPCAQERVRSPITSTTTPVSATAAKQQHQDNDNQDQFHWKPPFVELVLFAAHCILQSTDRVLHLAGSLVGLALSFQLLAVSYTHLDVYKRQAFTLAVQSMPSFRNLMDAYAQAFLEQVMVSVGCNGAHSLKQRLALSLIHI